MLLTTTTTPPNPYDRASNSLWISDANYALIENKLKEKQEEAKRMKDAKIEFNRRIADEGQDRKAIVILNRDLNATPSEADIKQIIGWDKNSKELNDMLINRSWNGDPTGYYFTTTEWNTLKQHYGVGQQPAQPVLPPIKLLRRNLLNQEVKHKSLRLHKQKQTE